MDGEDVPEHHGESSPNLQVPSGGDRYSYSGRVFISHSQGIFVIFPKLRKPPPEALAGTPALRQWLDRIRSLLRCRLSAIKWQIAIASKEEDIWHIMEREIVLLYHSSSSKKRPITFLKTLFVSHSIHIVLWIDAGCSMYSITMAWPRYTKDLMKISETLSL